MQRLTFELIGTRAPATETDSESIRIRMNGIGYLDPSIILKTDPTVKITRENNIYTISSNLTIINEANTVSGTDIILNNKNYGIQELLVNADDLGDPGYVEITNYIVTDSVITLDTMDYDGKEAFIKYLSVK